MNTHFDIEKEPLLAAACKVGKSGKKSIDTAKLSEFLVQKFSFVVFENKSRKIIHWYTDNGYECFGDFALNNLCCDIFSNNEFYDNIRPSHWEEILRNLRKDARIPHFKEWPRDVISCANGVLDPFTLTLSPNTPDNIVHRLGVTWNPDAQCDAVDLLFEEIKDSNDRVLTKIMLASALVGNPSGKFFVHIGDYDSIYAITRPWGEIVQAWHPIAMRDVHTEYPKSTESFKNSCMLVGCDLFKEFLTTPSMKNLLDYKTVVIDNAEDPVSFHENYNAYLLQNSIFVHHGYIRRVQPGRSVEPEVASRSSENTEEFKSRMFYLVMEEFQKHITKGANGEVILNLPEESARAKAVRTALKFK